MFPEDEYICTWATKCLVKDKESSTLRTDLFESYCSWLGKTTGRFDCRKIPSIFYSSLGRLFTSERFSHVSKKNGKKGGQKVVYYVGIKLVPHCTLYQSLCLQ